MADVLLQVHNGSKAFGSRTLFERASFAVNEGEHIGVIGPNGAGKTTLFRCLTLQDQLDSGQIIRSHSLRLGYLAQEEFLEPGLTVSQYWENICQMPLWDLKRLGQKMGLTDSHLSSPIAALSGGYRMRCKLIGLIGQQPNLLLLDEPTNYLDLESLLVLEEFLQSFDGAFLLISHDREFLRRTTDHTLEVEAGDFTKFNGHIDDYFEQKALLREQLSKQAMSQDAKRKTILQFAARFGAKATKARQVQSRLKRLDKMDSIELKPILVGASIPIAPPFRTGKTVLSAEDLCVGYGDRTILSGIELSLERADHVGIVGVNGAGKTSLLKVLAGVMAPLQGTLKSGHGVTTGYYAQHVAEELNLTDTVYEALMRKAHPDILPQQARDLAGALLFSGTDIEKKVKILSGGEKARVALGQILLKRSPLLILDEPTNHLDFHTVEALTQALQSYEGAVVIVSHDRSFIKRLAKKIIEIKDGKALLYPGTYDEYVWSQRQGILSTPSHQSNSTTGNTTLPTRSSANNLYSANPGSENSSGLSSKPKEQRKKIEKEIAAFEKEMSLLQRKISSDEKRCIELTEALQTSSGSEAQAKMKELSDLGKQLSSLEEKWFSLIEQLEQARESLK
jgi:ATP-binding cassette subfamily F protein 3